MTEDQIKHMVQRFLGRKLPKDFSPDCGISFDPIVNKGHAFESRRDPVGTNLLDAQQGEAMIRYLVEGMPGDLETRVEQLEKWVKNYRPVYVPPTRY